jgi:hypothetical protein
MAGEARCLRALMHVHLIDCARTGNINILPTLNMCLWLRSRMCTRIMTVSSRTTSIPMFDNIRFFFINRPEINSSLRLYKTKQLQKVNKKKKFFSLLLKRFYSLRRIIMMRILNFFTEEKTYSFSG